MHGHMQQEQLHQAVDEVPNKMLSQEPWREETIESKF